MSTVTEAGAIIPGTADEIITYGRGLYRRAQQADWPEDAARVLVKACSRLWTETEIIARLHTDGFTVTAGRRATWREAASHLIGVIHAYCGPAAAEDAARAREEEGRRAA